MKKLLLVLLCLVLQCNFPKRLQDYPLQTRRLFLHHFINHSYSPGVNHNLDLSLRKEISRRAGFNLSEEAKEAYLWLHGQIISYQKNPRFHSRSQEAKHYELLVLCRVRLRENPDKIKNKEARLLLSEELGARVYFSDKEGYAETEAKALKRLLYILALRINSAVEKAYLENFSPNEKGAGFEEEQKK